MPDYSKEVTQLFDDLEDLCSETRLTGSCMTYGKDEAMQAILGYTWYHTILSYRRPTRIQCRLLNSYFHMSFSPEDRSESLRILANNYTCRFAQKIFEDFCACLAHVDAGLLEEQKIQERKDGYALRTARLTEAVILEYLKLSEDEDEFSINHVKTMFGFFKDDIQKEISAQRQKLKSSGGSSGITDDSLIEDDDSTLEDLLYELDHMTGLDPVKEQVHSLVNYLKVSQKRKEFGMEDEKISLHLIFEGNPGTGKTTVARLIGKLYQKMGVLSKGHVVEVSRPDLVGEYIGHTAVKTTKKLNEAEGGILFIDEAYTLTQTDGRDFGPEAVDTILKYMEDNRQSCVIIAAGYPARMEQFLDSREGLRSRFSRIITFPDYSTSELCEIFSSMVQEQQYTLTDECRKMLPAVLEESKRCGGPNFGNGRYVRNLLEKARIEQANRLCRLPDLNWTREQVVLLEETDIQKAASGDVWEKLQETLLA